MQKFFEYLEKQKSTVFEKFRFNRYDNVLDLDIKCLY